jgi:hypothetical protein
MIAANLILEALRDLWGPGLVFLVLCGWLVRRAIRAARNESILEEQRMRAAFGEAADPSAPEGSTPPDAVAAPAPAPAEASNVTALPAASPAQLARPPASVPQRLAGADVRGSLQEHLDAVAQAVTEREAVPGARRCEVLWVRSTGTHAAWAERRPGQRELICVAQIDDGKIVARWQFG